MNKRYLCIAIAAIAMVGCTKEQNVDLSGYATTAQLEELRQQFDSQESSTLYEFTINFPAVENQHYSQVQYNGLVGKVAKDDAILVYSYLYGAWTQLPYCLDNTAIAYWRTDEGTLYFRYGRSNYIEITQDAISISIRAIVIPQSTYIKMTCNGVNMNSFNDVISTYLEMKKEMQ